ncbi:hypothetical protein WH47_08345 [Habropoda laboriosa]|uniref:Uncharacterized protein n=1 Tax=Habropoda laboriosa TaxID=597456 RepID=A0A0L7RGX4_9HYME|nr:hypothetical protein WH47_08345 [Habropoda laboriosa]
MYDLYLNVYERSSGHASSVYTRWRGVGWGENRKNENDEKKRKRYLTALFRAQQEGR